MIRAALPLFARLKRPFLVLTLAVIFLPTTQAQPAIAVELATDFLEQFASARVTNALECGVRRPASAGGIKQNGLFEHPLAPDRPARAEYAITLPAPAPDSILLLAFDIAIADGIQPGKSEDGVRFVIELDGERLFAQEWRECRWHSAAVDLTSFAGRTVRLTFVTEAMANTAYDWAVWGNPRLLQFRGQPHRFLNSQNPTVGISYSAGAVALHAPAGVQFQLQSDTGETLARWTSPSGTATPTWMVHDIALPNGRTATLHWHPKDAPVEIWSAPYPPRPRLIRVAPTRGLFHVGDPVSIRAEIKNEGRGALLENQAALHLNAGPDTLPSQKIPAIAPGETWRAEWLWASATQLGHLPITARLQTPDGAFEQNGSLEFLSPTGETASIQNQSLKLEFIHASGGYAYAKVLSRQNDNWQPVGVWGPLGRIITETRTGTSTLTFRPAQARRDHSAKSLLFQQRLLDPDGAAWTAQLRVALEPGRPLARLSYQWQTDQPRQLRALWGPNLYIGEGITGAAKAWGLFPGLEYLFGAEQSSNPRDFGPPLEDRRTPHPHKPTVPLMAITLGPENQLPPDQPGQFFAPDSLKDQPWRESAESRPKIAFATNVTVALFWDPHQRWDGQHAFPSPRFSSPNFDEGMENHRLALFLPSTPDYVPENAPQAEPPFALPKEKPLRLEASLLVVPGPVNAAVGAWLHDTGGLPAPHPWPRSFQEELDLCRIGFLKTVWDPRNEKWRHCIGWNSHHAPGFAALLWLDGQIADKPENRAQSRARVELTAGHMLRDGGPASLISQTGCHIMQWEFPFYYGYLPEALAGIEHQIENLIRIQQPNGAWLYQPANAEQAGLGQDGDSVLGTCANRAATLLRYARITGDPKALAAGEKALHFMESFRVPRGGQTWECPMYEPDILAAGYAIRAYLDAYRVTGNSRWLHNAVYWAETGVPFIYLWTLPDLPMMLGAVIPVFGSTFYSHSWLAMPVQWCGLVYSYHLYHLAQELERTPLAQTDSPLPLALNFQPADWKRIVELIAVSAMYQQFDSGDKIGSYPDSISRFEQRNPAFLNPEDILVNVLALQGHDPDIKTARLKHGPREIIVSSAAGIHKLDLTSNSLRFQLQFFPGETSHTFLSGFKPQRVLVDGQLLPQSQQALRRELGWYFDAAKSRLYITARHENAKINLLLHGHTPPF